MAHKNALAHQLSVTLFVLWQKEGLFCKDEKNSLLNLSSATTYKCAHYYRQSSKVLSYENRALV